MELGGAFGEVVGGSSEEEVDDWPYRRHGVGVGRVDFSSTVGRSLSTA